MFVSYIYIFAFCLPFLLCIISLCKPILFNNSASGCKFLWTFQPVESNLKYFIKIWMWLWRSVSRTRTCKCDWRRRRSDYRRLSPATRRLRLNGYLQPGQRRERRRRAWDLHRLLPASHSGPL